MANNYTLSDPAQDYEYGDDFSYESWTPGTRATLVNVPWNSDYRDVWEYGSRAALDAYIDSHETAGIVIDQISYIKPGNPIRIPTPFNVANRFNYIRVSNPIQTAGDAQKNYYYFITDVRQMNFSTTEIVVQLDVWATWSIDVVFGNCYIDRGHIGIANSQAYTNYGRDYLTIPEGLDIGGEYQTVLRANHAIMSPTSPDELEEDIFNILVVATIDLEQTPGTVNSPNFATAHGGTFAGMPSGATQYLWKSATALQNWLTANTGNPWITQGIVSITIIPPLKDFGISLDWPTDDGPTRMPAVKWSPRVHTMLTNWRSSPDIKAHIDSRYQGLYKLWTYPYMVVELTTFTGSPILLKPESWDDADATVIERINPAAPDQRIAFSPYRYNAAPTTPANDMWIGSAASGSPALGDDGGDYIDLATYIANFPSLMIVNNAGIAYLASNAHGIAFQHSSADWAQQRALQGNQVSYDQQTGAINTARELTGIGVGADYAQQAVQQNLIATTFGLSAGGGAASGLAGGGPAGLAAGAGMAALNALTSGAQSAAMSQSTDIRSNAANQGNNASNRQAGMVRDTNKSFADFSARGDYQNSIAGINARVQDAKLIQPTTSGQVGGDALNFLNNNVMLSVRIKMIDKAAIRAVGEFWLRYGYPVRQFGRLPTNLQVMTKFTYWKLQETYILSASMPEPYKQTIRGILEKGVTVWGNPDDIGNIDIADNAPLGGITL